MFRGGERWQLFGGKGLDARQPGMVCFGGLKTISGETKTPQGLSSSENVWDGKLPAV